MVLTCAYKALVLASNKRAALTMESAMESTSKAQYRLGAEVAICTFHGSTEKFAAILHLVQPNCGP